MKLGMGVMLLNATPNPYFYILKIGNTSMTDVGICEVGK
jgi:hypothetical protein